jgi:hypothetical protein
MICWTWRDSIPYATAASALESVDEYWFAMLLCDVMDPVGALKMVLGFNLLSTHPRNIKGGDSSTSFSA